MSTHPDMSDFPDNMNTLFINCRVCTMASGRMDTIKHAALAVTGRTISWVGRSKDLPESLRKGIKRSGTVIDCRNQWILPGFVDCHTHLVWAGSRADEFEKRLAGMTYEAIARQGGGINATVTATRQALAQDLYDQSAARLQTMIENGTTTVEIKSGYGLNLETELNILEVIHQLDQTFPAHVEATFLGAHALPPEFKHDPDGYIDFVTQTMLPAVKDQNIATAVDVFCEQIGFSRDQTEQVFLKAKSLGFDIKLHAEQLSDSKGAGLAAGFNALSCDHLEYLSTVDAQLMAEHNTSAVLLPGAFYYLHETRKPPIQTLRDLKIPMALATDLNPGTSPVYSMPLIMNLACNLFGLTCEEALSGATINGAKALGLAHRKGSLEVGKDADLIIWNINSPVDLCYAAGQYPIKQIMINGKII